MKYITYKIDNIAQIAVDMRLLNMHDKERLYFSANKTEKITDVRVEYAEKEIENKILITPQEHYNYDFKLLLTIYKENYL